MNPRICRMIFKCILTLFTLFSMGISSGAFIESDNITKFRDTPNATELFDMTRHDKSTGMIDNFDLIDATRQLNLETQRHILSSVALAVDHRSKSSIKPNKRGGVKFNVKNKLLRNDKKELWRKTGNKKKSKELQIILNRRKDYERRKTYNLQNFDRVKLLESLIVLDNEKHMIYHQGSNSCIWIPKCVTDDEKILISEDIENINLYKIEDKIQKKVNKKSVIMRKFNELMCNSLIRANPSDWENIEETCESELDKAIYDIRILDLASINAVPVLIYEKEAGNSTFKYKVGLCNIENQNE